jgi:two-component system, cell cycle sensor histidine kinase and response regulator CckA
MSHPAVKRDPKLDNDSKKDYILAEQVKKSYLQTTIAVVANLTNALVLTFFFLPVVPPKTVIGWASSLIALSGFRILLKCRFLRVQVPISEMIKWSRWNIFTMALSGCIWGAAGIFLFPVNSSIHQVFIAFVLGGMVAGSMGTFSVLRGAFLAFSLPVMTPIILRLFYIGDNLHFTMGAMLLMFWILMWFSAKRLFRTVETSISLQFENSGLISELRSEIKDRERAENELRDHQKQIEFTIDKRTAALNDAIDQLSLEIQGRKEIEDALRESEETYRDLVENINDVIYATDKNGIVTYVSPTIETIVGYGPEEVLDRNFADFLHPDDLPQATDRIATVLSGKIEPHEYRFHKKSGGYCWMQASSRPIYKDCRAIGIRGVLTDLTNQKKLEVQLQQAHKMEAIGTLAGGVAHDLNNILSGLVSYPQLLLMDISEDSPLYDPIRTIQRSGERAAAIVQDLLTLARRGVPVVETVSLNTIITEYLESPEYQNLLRHHPLVGFSVHLDPNLFNISGSRVHLSKTIMNLVTNAAEAIVSPGKISITTENRYVDASIPDVAELAELKEGDYVVLHISDTGKGIMPSDREKIFEPFYTKKVMGRSGTGLGMTVVWNTVQDHRGVIDISSTPGEGTTFTLYLPATRQTLTIPADDEDLSTLKGNAESILVVDDVAEQRDIAARILTKLGYTVTTAESGEKAVDYLRQSSFDLLLLDMIMESGMDGLATYEQAVALHPAQRAIIVSGFSETDRLRAAQKMGAGTYLKKPYLLQKLGRAVRNEIDRKLGE